MVRRMRQAALGIAVSAALFAGGASAVTAAGLPGPTIAAPTAPQQTAGTFSGNIPASGVALLVWNGGSMDDFIAAAATTGASTYWATSAGRFVPYSPSSPAFANQGFLSLYSGNVPAMTVVLAVFR